MQMRKGKTAAVSVRRQREVIRDVLLSPGRRATWLTLDELAKLTNFPPASISAQLRHLRKPRYGGFVVAKRCRGVNKAMRAEGFGALWEYSVQRRAANRRVGAAARRLRRPRSHATR